MEKAERNAAQGPRQVAPANAAAGEPLANLQWDMKMIGATPDGSYAVNPGNKGVLVGIIDTGIDGTHPDIAPNFNKPLSRNFTADIPDIDGPVRASKSCIDPADVDDDGHGTHVAGTIAAADQRLGHRRRRARVSRWSTSGPARTRASSSSARPSTR